MLYSLLGDIPFMGAGADPEPLLAAAEATAFGAGGIRGALGTSYVASAGILHHGHEGLTLFGEQRILQKVGINDRRITQGAAPIPLIIESVSKLKGLPKGRNDLVKIPLLRQILGVRGIVFHIHVHSHSFHQPARQFALPFLDGISIADVSLGRYYLKQFILIHVSGVSYIFSGKVGIYGNQDSGQKRLVRPGYPSILVVFLP